MRQCKNAKLNKMAPEWGGGKKFRRPRGGAMSRRNVLAAFLTATAVSLCASARAATENVLYYNTAGGTAN